MQHTVIACWDREPIGKGLGEVSCDIIRFGVTLRSDRTVLENTIVTPAHTTVHTAALGEKRPRSKASVRVRKVLRSVYFSKIVTGIPG